MLAATLQFKPDGHWSVESGTTREHSHFASTETAHTLFLRPSWSGRDRNVRLGVRLDYGTDRRIGRLFGDGYGGETSLRWKTCQKECSSAFAFDLSWKELESSVSSERLTERAASLRIELRL